MSDDRKTVWEPELRPADPPEEVDPELPPYAGFWIRAAAALIDLAVICGLFLTVIGIPVAMCYMPVMWMQSGATLGQKALALRVVREADGEPVRTKAAIVRFVVMLLECIFGVLGVLGFIWTAFDGKKQSWHDKAAGTIVIRVDRPIDPPGAPEHRADATPGLDE